MTNIDDEIEKWHESCSDLSLHEFLGMTWEQYGVFVSTGNDPRVTSNTLTTRDNPLFERGR